MRNVSKIVGHLQLLECISLGHFFVLFALALRHGYDREIREVVVGANGLETRSVNRSAER